MHNFTSFYYKELLQKMQVSIFEKYIPYTDSKETMLISAMVWYDAITLHWTAPQQLESQGDRPKCVAIVSAQLLPSPLVTANSTHLPRKDKPLSQAVCQLETS